MSYTVATLKIEDLPKVPLVLDSLSSRFIRENRVIPLELKNSILKVLMADPGNSDVIDALHVALSAEVHVYGGDEKAIDEYISRYYGQDSQEINKIIEHIDETTLEYPSDEGEDVGH